VNGQHEAAQNVAGLLTACYATTQNGVRRGRIWKLESTTAERESAPATTGQDEAKQTHNPPVAGSSPARPTQAPRP
jgi:hypothetical protein